MRFRMMMVLLLANFVPPSHSLADAAASLQARSKEYPFDDELRVLAEDLASPIYRRVLDTMIPTDLEAEWQRVATRDNYQKFLTNHGGKETVLADPALKSAYEARLEVARGFTALIRSAYEAKKRRPPFDDAKVDELCAKATATDAKSTSESAVPIRALMPTEDAERHWPQFRGPTGQGIVVDDRFPMHWSATENVLWRTKLPGLGNSSPIVWAGQLFITAASPDGKERWLLAYSTLDGQLLWRQAAPITEYKAENLYQKNTFASSTPVTDGERVIAFFGNAGMLCCNMGGKILWLADLGPFPTMHGPGASPILYRDKVILVQDQIGGESVFVALDKATGEEKWRKERPKAMCWSTPIVVHAGQKDELLYNGSHNLIGYDPDSGEERWRFTGVSRESIPMPVLGGGLIYSFSGRNGPIHAIRPGGQGDVTTSHAVWSLPRGGPHVPTPIWVAGRLFWVNDLGIASCLDAVTGKTLWQKRLSGRFSTSMLSAGDKLLVTNEEGATYILRAADQFEQLAVNDLAEYTLATPAILGGRIYFRTSENLICVGEK